MATRAAISRSVRSGTFPTVGALGFPMIVATSLVVFALTRRNALTGSIGFDEGVYFGSALRLAAHALPARDFVLVHPPGLAVLLWPLAAISNLSSTSDGLVLARIATGIAAIVNVGLIGYVVRRHGPFTMFVTATLLAIHPLAFTATHTILLEPWMLLCCLAALSTAFDADGHLASSNRLVVAGLLLGLGASIKLWGLLFLMPVVAIAVWHRRRRGAVETLGPALLAFGAIAGPMFLLAPFAFLRDVVIAQTNRRGDGIWRLALDERLTLITGLGDYPFSGGTMQATLAVTGLAFAVIVVLIASPKLRPIDIAAFATSAFAALAFARSPDFYRYYAYIAAASLLLSIGATVGLATSLLRRSWTPTSMAARRGLIVLFALPVVVATLRVLPHDRERITSYLSTAEDSADMLRAAIPKGSCVAFDEPGPLIAADRFLANDPGCPLIIDPFGTMMALNDGRIGAPYGEEICRLWTRALDQADYVTLVGPRSGWVAWCPDVATRFTNDFRQVARDRTIVVWQRSSFRP